LQEALSAEHSGISKTKLRKIVSANIMLFSIGHNGVQLCELDHGFVQGYLELAEGVETVEHQIKGSYSSSEPVYVHMSKSVMVSGLLCTSCVSAKGSAIIFKFGGYRAFRMSNPIPVNKIGAHMVKACIRFRKFCQIFAIYWKADKKIVLHVCLFILSFSGSISGTQNKGFVFMAKNLLLEQIFYCFLLTLN
jgi:hypothetical protein